MQDGRDTLHWISEQTSRNENNASSSIQAWAGCVPLFFKACISA